MDGLRFPIGSVIAVVATVLVSGCGTAPISGTAGPSVEAPVLQVGDRWVYHAIDGYRQKTTWDETHEIRAIDANGITVNVTINGPTVNFARTEVWSAPGVVRSGAIYEAETDRFDPALIRYQYPMTDGSRWNQSIRNLNKPPSPFGDIRFNATVGGYESVSTPAGTFNAIKLRYLIQLDDATFWRNATQCDYVIWYAPSVGAMVREQKRSYYLPKDIEAGAEVPGQNAVYELTSYARGR